MGLCRNEANCLFVILNPSPFVTLSEALYRMVYRAK
jgi:hypothetical protein